MDSMVFLSLTVLIILNLVDDNSSSLVHYIYSTETNQFLHIEKDKCLCVLCKSLLIKSQPRSLKAKKMVSTTAGKVIKCKGILLHIYNCSCCNVFILFLAVVFTAQMV